MNQSKLILQSPNGKRRIILEATDSIAGIWIEGHPNEHLICVYHNDQMPCIGMYGPGKKEIVSIGLGVDHNGDPTIQFAKNGEVRFLTMEQIKNLPTGPVMTGTKPEH